MAIPSPDALCAQYLIPVGKTPCDPPNWPDNRETWATLGKWVIATNVSGVVTTKSAALGGQLILHPDGPQAEFPDYDVFIRTADTYDLRGYEIIVRVEPSRGGDGYQTMLEVLSPVEGVGNPWPIASVEAADNSGGQLRAFVQYLGASQLETPTYARASHVYWRMRFGHDSDYIQIDVAGDCGTWANLIDLANPDPGAFPMTCMSIRIFDNIWDGAITGDEVTRIGPMWIRPFDAPES